MAADATKHAEGKCGADGKSAEGKCGADKGKAAGAAAGAKTKTGDKKSAEGKCGEGKICVMHRPATSISSNAHRRTGSMPVGPPATRWPNWRSATR
ncbi:hypothetical protein G6F21_014478 [Rhizopus arrhizus]|nr:hypothetical protein G6F21_014478 [Rhizopus arrhizus]